MRIRSWLGSLLAVAVLLAGGGEATADDRWFVSGELEIVDEEAHRIVVNGKTLRVGPRAKIKRDGEAATWADVVDREEGYVTALVRRGYGGADRVLTIVLDDEISDDSE